MRCSFASFQADPKPKRVIPRHKDCPLLTQCTKLEPGRRQPGTVVPFWKLFLFGLLYFGKPRRTNWHFQCDSKSKGAINVLFLRGQNAFPLRGFNLGIPILGLCCTWLSPEVLRPSAPGVLNLGDSNEAIANKRGQTAWLSQYQGNKQGTYQT